MAARIRAAILVAAAAAMVASAGVSPEPSEAGAYPGANGLIAFARETFDPFGFGIFVVDPDGGAPTPVGPGLGDDEPAWSPDGSRIAFTSVRNGDNQIFVMNADGSGETPLTNADGNSCPTWSPDGTRIAFSDGDGNIVVMNADGTDQQVILDTDTCSLSWGVTDRIVFSVVGTGISVVDADGSGLQPLTAGDTDDAPNWSPDGSRIIFTRQGPASGDQIFVMNADGSDPTALTSGEPHDATPAYSPDGSRIVFSRCAGADSPPCHLFTMPAGGGTPVPLTDGDDVVDLQADWQPIPGPSPPPPPAPPPPEPLAVTPRFTG